jgi:ligand-binding sensor domain-containing protein
MVSLLLACLGAPAACWWAVAFFDLSLPSVRRIVSAPPTPVTWTALPSPKVVHQNWASFTNADSIRGTAAVGPLLWAATDGGAVVWDMTRNTSVKFAAEHGLTSNRLTGVAAAPDGSLWFSAHTGLSRYDGADWTTFTTQNGLASDNVRDLVIRLDGAVWVATAGGVNRYDGYEWKTFTAGNTLYGLISDDVRALAFAPKGLWAITPSGVSFYNGNDWQAYEYPDELAGDEVWDAAAAPDGSIWIGTRVGLRHFDGATWERLTVRDGLLDNAVHALVVTDDSAVWIGYGDAGLGLTRYDGFTFQTFTLTDGLIDDHVQSLTVGAAGELWIGAAHGLSRFDGSAWKNFVPPSEIPTNSVRSLLAARQAVWIASEGGVSRYDNSGWKLYTTADGLTRNDTYALAPGPNGSPLVAYETPALGLSHLTGTDIWQSLACHPTPLSAHVNAGASAPDGSIWFATDKGVSRYQNGEWQTFTLADGLPDVAIQTLAVGDDGTVWIGSARGLAAFRDDRWQLVTRDDVRLLTITGDQLWAITPQGLSRLAEGRLLSVLTPFTSDIRALTSANGEIWIATASGIASYNGGGWRTYTTADGLASNDVRALAIGNDGGPWAGYDDPKLGFSHLVNGRWESFPEAAAVKPTLINKIVNDILITPDEATWFGTAGGVSRFGDGEWRSFTTADGLPADEVRALAWAFDSVWAATANGVGRFNGEDWQKFDSASGLASDDVYTLAVAPDGKLWIGFDKFRDGFTLYDGQSWRTVPVTEGDHSAIVRTLEVSADGRLWAGGDSQPASGGVGNDFIGIYDGQRWRLRPTSGITYRINQIKRAPDDRMWLTVYGGGGLQIWDVSNNSIGRSVVKYSEPTYPNRVAFAKEGVVWVSVHFRNELYRFDGVTWKSISVPPPLTEITALAAADDGGLWVGTDQGAAHYVNSRWQLFPPPAANYEPRPTGALSALAIAADGSAWFGTSTGDIRQYRNEYPFSNFYTQIFGANPISAIFPASDGSMWLTSRGSGVARWDGKRWQRFRPAPETGTATVQGLAVAADGSAWMATTHGAVQWTPGQCAFNDPIGIANVLTIAADPTGGVWAGTYVSGALHHSADGLLTSAKAQTDEFVPAMLTAPNGALWLITGDTVNRGNALLRFKDREWERLDLPPERIEGGLTGLALAPNNVMWIGTRHGVLYFENGGWRALTNADGLADNTILTLLAAPDGALWFATPGGLSRYRP